MLVEVHDPLKEGLKHRYVPCVNCSSVVEVHDPLKEGLKHHESITVELFFFVEVHDPLKEGLKLSPTDLLSKTLISVEVHDPLKEGLKQIKNTIKIVQIVLPGTLLLSTKILRPNFYPPKKAYRQSTSTIELSAIKQLIFPA